MTDDRRAELRGPAGACIWCDEEITPDTVVEHVRTQHADHWDAAQLLALDVDRRYDHFELEDGSILSVEKEQG